jgi:cobalamin biosynthesis Co2+ chelatase CbiK
MMDGIQCLVRFSYTEDYEALVKHFKKAMHDPARDKKEECIFMRYYSKKLHTESAT